MSGIRREIYALSRVRHPGIARIVDAGQHEGLPFYAMELYEGETLAAHLSRVFGAWAEELQGEGVTTSHARARASFTATATFAGDETPGSTGPGSGESSFRDADGSAPGFAAIRSSRRWE